MQEKIYRLVKSGPEVKMIKVLAVLWQRAI